MKNNRAAMEMSVGTIVTIVLLMTILILGLVLIRTIFKSSVENINGIDSAVKGEINKLFAEDDSRRVVVYPETRLIKIKKGSDSLGFGFSIRNVEDETKKIDYSISVQNEKDISCNLKILEAENLITLGKEGSRTIQAGNIDSDGIFVRFNIPENAPPCQIRYILELEMDGDPYVSSYCDLTIEGK